MRAQKRARRGPQPQLRGALGRQGGRLRPQGGVPRGAPAERAGGADRAGHRARVEAARVGECALGDGGALHAVRPPGGHPDRRGEPGAAGHAEAPQQAGLRQPLRRRQRRQVGGLPRARHRHRPHVPQGGRAAVVHVGDLRRHEGALPGLLPHVQPAHTRGPRPRRQRLGARPAVPCRAAAHPPRHPPLHGAEWHPALAPGGGRLASAAGGGAPAGAGRGHSVPRAVPAETARARPSGVYLRLCGLAGSAALRDGQPAGRRAAGPLGFLLGLPHGEQRRAERRERPAGGARLPAQADPQRRRRPGLQQLVCGAGDRGGGGGAPGATMQPAQLARAARAAFAAAGHRQGGRARGAGAVATRFASLH
mmetsp:Transcript_1284/g.3259  ORF Transcript_1284/g.3259 Transcript_1284/m.3259 type:complete len:365 (-) Transcript_1284:30-1124(-)